LNSIYNLFKKYPKGVGIHPNALRNKKLLESKNTDEVDKIIAVESVVDRFYFLLFGAIIGKMKEERGIRTQLLVVMSVNSSIGTGFLSELKRAAPIVWFKNRPWVRAYGLLIDKVANRCSTWGNPLDDLIDWIKAGKVWNELLNNSEYQSLNINGIVVGDLIIDSYLRLKPSPKFEVKDRFVKRLLWQAIRDIRKYDAYFSREKPFLYISSYCTYIEHGIPVRIALKHGVNVLSFGNLNQFGKILTIDDPYQTKNCSLYRSDFESLDRQSERISLAREQLELRLAGGVDRATTYMKLSAYTKSGYELPDDLEGAVVIFLHDFYDSPHIYPDMFFQDFWEWICFTIDVLHQAKIAFYLKPHPNQVKLSEGVLASLQLKYKFIRWLPAKINNLQVIKAKIICGITVYGSVAHELAYLGVPSISCAKHPHHAFNFSRTATTKEEYRLLLQNSHERIVSKYEMRRQALIFYYMHNLYDFQNDRQLQEEFINFWRVCNIGNNSQRMVMQSLKRLTELPSFISYIRNIFAGNTVPYST
jgi:hypothetical protein